MEYCAQHALERMVDVNSRKCITNGCGKLPSSGVAGTKTVTYCAKHASNVYLAGILTGDDLCIFEYLILASAGTDFKKSWCSEKEVWVGCTG